MQADLDVIEEKERDTFMQLSAAMRDSYEKERARVERTKNWSLIGTVVGAIVGRLFFQHYSKYNRISIS